MRAFPGPLVQLAEPLSSPKSRINRVKDGAKDDKTKGKQRAGTGSRSAGKLSKLLTMPLDVIFEVRIVRNITRNTNDLVWHVHHRSFASSARWTFSN